MVLSIDPGQEPDIVLLHLPFKVIEVDRVDGDVGDKGMAVGRGRVGSYLAVAHGISSRLILGLIVETEYLSVAPSSGLDCSQWADGGNDTDQAGGPGIVPSMAPSISPSTLNSVGHPWCRWSKLLSSDQASFFQTAKSQENSCLCTLASAECLIELRNHAYPYQCS
jgi:hypothetical protein